MVGLNSCMDSLSEDYCDQGDKHILALLVLQLSGSVSGRHTTLCLELTSSHCNFWAVCNLTGFESSSAAGLMYPCSLTFCCTHRAERKPLLCGSVLYSCSLSYNKSSVLEAVSKKRAVTLQWSKHHPLWTSTKWCSHCLSSCSPVDSKCQTFAISKFNNWYNKSSDYPCFSSVCASCCVLNYLVSFLLQRAGRSLL